MTNVTPVNPVKNAFPAFIIHLDQVSHFKDTRKLTSYFKHFVIIWTESYFKIINLPRLWKMRRLQTMYRLRCLHWRKMWRLRQMFRVSQLYTLSKKSRFTWLRYVRGILRLILVEILLKSSQVKLNWNTLGLLTMRPSFGMFQRSVVDGRKTVWTL